MGKKQYILLVVIAVLAGVVGGILIGRGTVDQKTQQTAKSDGVWSKIIENPPALLSAGAALVSAVAAIYATLLNRKTSKLVSPTMRPIIDVDLDEIGIRYSPAKREFGLDAVFRNVGSHPARNLEIEFSAGILEDGEKRYKRSFVSRANPMYQGATYFLPRRLICVPPRLVDPSGAPIEVFANTSLKYEDSYDGSTIEDKLYLILSSREKGEVRDATIEEQQQIETHLREGRESTQEDGDLW